MHSWLACALVAALLPAALCQSGPAANLSRSISSGASSRLVDSVSGDGANARVTARQATGTNPFAGAVFYVNPDYAKNAAASLAQVAAGSTDAAKIRTVQGISTAIWLDRIDAIKGGAANGGRLSLTGHLDAALAQAAAAGKPAVVPIVVYDLPSRDCAALASNGELGIADLPKYKAQYIDAIAAAIRAKPAYAALRIVAVVEPDSLPNMVTNLGVPTCAAVNSQNTYVNGVTYALQKLGALPNVDMYLDIGHSGWLVWPNNMQGGVSLYANLITTAEAGGPALVRGLATDIANYTPLKEPFVSPSNQSVLSGPFYEWNPVFDEQTYVQTLATNFANAGVPGLGFIIDTSRSGWKAANDGRPIDKRKARGNWCNVNGAGLGERPRASPVPSLPIDAYVWVKPPGESDGSSQATTPGNVPDAEGKRFDPSCDPNDASKDAMAGAPPAGGWFHAQFMMLVRNAQPAVATGLTAPTPTAAPTAPAKSPPPPKPTARPPPPKPTAKPPPPKPTAKPPPPKPTAKSPPPKPTAKSPPPKPTAKSPPPKPTAKSPPPKPTAKPPPPKPVAAATPTKTPTAAPTSPTPTPTSGVGAAPAIQMWGQCGGLSGPAGNPLGDYAWASQGGAACAAGATCTRSNEWYWQCLPTTG